MLAIYELRYKIHITIGDHDGYCSGSECEDKDKEIFEIRTIPLSMNSSKLFDCLIRMLLPQKLNLLLQMYRHVSFDASDLCGGGSNYCGASPSGLQHNYRLNSCILQQVKFTKFTLNDGRREHLILSTTLKNLKKIIYNILFVLKRYRIVKDMRILIIQKFLNKTANKTKIERVIDF